MATIRDFILSLTDIIKRNRFLIFEVIGVYTRWRYQDTFHILSTIQHRFSGFMSKWQSGFKWLARKFDFKILTQKTILAPKHSYVQSTWDEKFHKLFRRRQIFGKIAFFRNTYSGVQEWRPTAKAYLLAPYFKLTMLRTRLWCVNLFIQRLVHDWRQNCKNAYPNLSSR